MAMTAEQVKAKACVRAAIWYSARRTDPVFMARIAERTKLQNRRRYAYPARRVSMLANSRRWKKENRAAVLAMNAKRRAAQINATPEWADQEAVERFYMQARALTVSTGVSHEVDHIEPLLGDAVCGLHVECNLQILTASANRSKKNRVKLC